MNRLFACLCSTLTFFALGCIFPTWAHAENGNWSDDDIALEKSGDRFYEKSDFQTAESLYREVLERNPDSSPALLFDVKGLIGLGRYSEALTESEKAAALDPDSVLAWEWIGISKVHLGKYEEAITALKKSLELNPHDEGTSIWLAVATLKTGDSKQANQIFDRLQQGEDKESQIDTWSNIGNTFHQIGDDFHAIMWLKRSAILGNQTSAESLSWIYSYGNVTLDSGESAYWDRIASDSYPWFPRLAVAEKIIAESHGWILVAIAILSAAILPMLTIGIVVALLGRGLTKDPSVHWTERARRSYPIQTVLGISIALPFIHAGSVSLFPGSMLPISKWLLGPVVFIVAAAVTHLISIKVAARFRDEPVSYLRNLQNFVALLFLYVPFIGGFVIMSFYLPSQWGLYAELVISAGCLAYFWMQFGGWIRLGRLLRLLIPAGPELTQIAGDLARQYGHPAPSVWILRWRRANAFALIFANAIVVTEKICELLHPEELRAVIGHELGHLREKFQTRIILLLAPFFLLPIFTMSLWIDSANGYAVIACGTALLLVFFLLPKLRRRMEVTADALGKQIGGETDIYPRALSRLYESSLVPSVMPGKRKVHPHLYDRMLAAGITPDYPRPKPPSRWGLIAVIFVLAANFIGLNAIWLLLF